MRIAGVLLVRQSCCWSSSYRTHLVGDLIDRVGQCVRLCGWLNHRRQGRFGVVGDHSGCVQFYADPGHTANYSEFTKTSLQSCISVAGTVERRPLKDQRMSGSLDLLEVRADHFKVINACRHPIPFNPSASLPSEQTRQRFRLFDLRSPETQSVLRARSSFLRSVRDFFYDHNFTEIETPVLTTTASESGANEFKCKSTKTNACYVLAQSPQIYKQMLMIGCFDRYFQVAKCFRDEQVTSLRQPEFTQIDFEMAFADTNQILALGEDLVKSTLHSITKNEIRFDQMTYDEALSQYGTDILISTQ